MSFFHNLNKTLDSIAARPESAQLNERDMSRAAKGYEKYGKEGMEALAKAGREGKDLDKVRAKYDRYDNKEVDEGLGDVVKKVGGMAKKAGSAVLNKVGHGDDVDMIRDLQRKMDMPQTGKKPEQKTDEAAKYRDPKYKDKLYTVEPLDYTYGPDADELYYNPKPDDYEGRKRKIGGGEFSHNDPLRKGDGIGRSGIKNNILDRGPRKGLPSRDQITSLKSSIKSAKGTHTEPNLPEAGAPMTAKQKSFAALAEPKDKITFADKIAGAKKEVDEMLGDVAAEAMRNALGGRQQVADEGNAFTGALAKTPKGGKFKVGGKEFTDTSSVDEDDDKNPFTNYKKPRTDTPRTGEVTHGAKHDTEWTATGRKVTRRVDPQGNSVGSETDAEGNTIEKRGRGRPKGAPKGPERTTANAYKHKGERKVKEGEVSTGNLQKMHQLVTGLKSYIQDDDGQAALKELTALIKHYASQGSEQELDEKAVSKKQQKFMGMVHAAQKGEKPASKEVAKTAKSMDKKDAEDFASTKHKGLPEKKKSQAKESESNDSDADNKEDAPKKSKSKFKFGGSVYEALDAQLETLITEGMSVTVNMSQDAEHGEDRKNITVNADGEDADRLAELLQMAGMSQQSGSCDTCGSSPCGCDMIDENNPNWPSNTETSDNAMQYSGGLNGPKSTGQATTPVLASQVRRQATMEESARVEQNLLNLYRTFGK